MATQAEETVKSLQRIQDTDAKKLARADELGGSFNLSAAVAPAERLINLFRLLPPGSVTEFPPNYLTIVQQNANNVFNLFEQIRGFNIETANLGQFRTQIVSQLTEAYNAAWTGLHPLIGYSAARAVDFERLEREGRAAVQAINDRTTELLNDMQGIKTQAQAALDAARRAASEHGVSQQAMYFKTEADSHETASKTWRTATIWLAAGLGVYALATIFLHKWTWLKPADTAESAQLITGKILIFAVISYMLILAARNFLSHKHNAIVNRHRQNALMTFNALATAAKDESAKDIILSHAAACIFAPQETGYAKSAAQESSLGQAMAGLLAKGESK
jgi:hypothetical protein